MTKKRSGKKKKKADNNKIIVGISILIVIAIAIFVISSQNASSANFLETTEGVKIAYNYFPPTNPDLKDTNKGVILLHQFGLNKESYNKLIPLLGDYHVIAIDFRGFGESDLNHGDFDDFDYQTMINDVNSAIVFLNQKGVNGIGIVGASMGANTALNAAKTFRDVKTAVLLSPGIEYRGININTASQTVEKPILIIVAKGDTYSYDSSRKIVSNLKNGNIQIEGEGHHGTEILSAPTIQDIVNWLHENIKEFTPKRIIN